MKTTLIITIITLSAIIGRAQENKCEKIEIITDKFNGEKTFKTPMIDLENPGYPRMSNIGYQKVIYKGGVDYYLSLSAPSDSPMANRKGVTFILKNGKKINKPNQTVETGVIRSSFERRAFIKLTKADLLLLSKSPITDFKLYVDQGEVRDPDRYVAWVNCLLDSK